MSNLGKVYNRELNCCFPLHLEAYETQGDSIVLDIINRTKQHIDGIDILYNENQYHFTPDTDQFYVTLTLDHAFSYLGDVPKIASCVIAGKSYLFSDKDEPLFLQKAKSVYFLGIERHLYREKMAKILGFPKTDILYLAQDFGEYWNCVCGRTNLRAAVECPDCHLQKEKLFSVPVSVGDEALRTDDFKKANYGILLWLSVFFGLNIIIQMFGGDLFFENFTKNSFFGVTNRFLIPMAMILLSVGIIAASNQYRRDLILIQEGIRISSLLYLNAIMAVFPVLTAYNFLILVSYDLIFLIAFIYLHVKKLGHLYYDLPAAFTLILLFTSLFQLRIYSRYDLKIYDDGLFLTVRTDERDYSVPEMINRIPVSEVYFPIEYSFPMENLTVSRNLKRFQINSTAVLPALKTVSVKEENTVFEVRNNVLYQKGIIRLVPVAVREIVINEPVVPERALENCINLEKVTIGSNVEIIKTGAFSNCRNLKTVEFAADGKLRTIEARAFAGCFSLKSIAIPDTVTKMGIGVLANATSLESLTIPFLGEERETSDLLSESSDVLVFIFGDATYLHYQVIPQTLKTITVTDITMIHNVTFYHAQSVEAIYLPETLSAMGKSSFSGCTSLKQFTVPDGVTVLQENVFADTVNLTSIVIPASVIRIEANAFLNSGLTSVTYLGNPEALEIDPVGNATLITLLK